MLYIVVLCWIFLGGFATVRLVCISQFWSGCTRDENWLSASASHHRQVWLVGWYLLLDGLRWGWYTLLKNKQHINLYSYYLCIGRWRNWSAHGYGRRSGPSIKLSCGTPRRGNKKAVLAKNSASRTAHRSASGTHIMNFYIVCATPLNLPFYYIRKRDCVTELCAVSHPFHPPDISPPWHFPVILFSLCTLRKDISDWKHRDQGFYKLSRGYNWVPGRNHSRSTCSSSLLIGQCYLLLEISRYSVYCTSYMLPVLYDRNWKLVIAIRLLFRVTLDSYNCLSVLFVCCFCCWGGEV